MFFSSLCCAAVYYFHPEGPDALVHLDAIDAQGQRVATHATPQTSLRVIPPTWRTRIADLANMPVPSLVATFWFRTHTPNPVRSVLHVSHDLKSTGLAALFGLASGLSIAAIVWARKVGLDRASTGLWVAMTISFGAAGFLAYRLAADWPDRVRCPKCAHRRPVRDSSCPHCHEPWAAPRPRGSEIFEPGRSPVG